MALRDLRNSYRRRLRRKYFLWRGFRSRFSLRCVSDHTGQISKRDILLFATLRNERIRLPWFLEYYRRLGIGHFLIVDNGSDDGSAEYLSGQPDVSLWSTRASYKRARFGIDWMNHLLRRYGSRHWTLTVDPDEFLIYPFSDTRPLAALTDWLDTIGAEAFPAMLLDMYPRGPLGARPYVEGTDPFAIANAFDSGNYMISINPEYRNLWIQGGVRARVLFADHPADAPSLNKIPLVRWRRGYAFVSSTHALLPRRLNVVYDRTGGEMASGCLLHAKFLSTLPAKASEEMQRREHFAQSREYSAYADGISADTDLSCVHSDTFINWRQLEIIGLMSRGEWG